MVINHFSLSLILSLLSGMLLESSPRAALVQVAAFPLSVFCLTSDSQKEGPFIITFGFSKPQGLGTYSTSRKVRVRTVNGLPDYIFEAS